MAEFLTRLDIVDDLHRIIKEAEKELILISPYIKADKDTKELLRETKRSTTINVIYGKKKLPSKEEGFLKDLSITTTFRENLHAKCYLNENEALLTSMNLYEFSQENNDEMGILVSREEDRDLYEAIHKQAIRYIGIAEPQKATGSVQRRKQLERRRPASAFGARPTCRSSPLSHTARAAMRAGSDTRTDVRGKALPYMRQRAQVDPAQALVFRLL